MFLKSAKFLLAVVITGLIGTAPFIEKAHAQAAAGKQFKDRAEYDLYEGIRTGKSPAENVAKLDEWKAKYPDTQYGPERLTMYLTNYVGLQKVAEVVATAKQILAGDANNFTALYYMTLYAQARVPAGVNPPPADILDDSEKAAQGMLANLDKQKPATMADAQWDAARKPLAALGQTTLGWVAMSRKQPDAAAAAFKQSLAIVPNNGLVDYWLATQLIPGYAKDTAKGPEMMFYMARAAAYTGEGEAPAGVKTAADNYLQKAYKGYHGSADGLDQVKAVAKANPIPPADFKILSVKEIDEASIKAEEEAAKSNPDLAKFKTIKAALTAADGANYFSTGVKDSELPTLRGKVVKLTPETNPKTILISIENAEGDVTLTMETAAPGKVDVGTQLSFEGVATAYTAEPFMLNLKLESVAKLHGWTGKGGAAPARRPAVPARKK